MNTLAVDLSSKTIKLGLKLKGEEKIVLSDNATEHKTDRIFFFFLGY